MSEPQHHDPVHHPLHYTAAGPVYETINVIEAWQLGYHLGNAVKYISRAGKKSAETEAQDLEKARWYLDRRIQHLKGRHAMNVEDGAP